MTRVKIKNRVLKGLCVPFCTSRLDSLVCALSCPRMLIVVSDISDVNLIVLSKSFTDLSNKAFYFVSDCVPQGEDIVNVSFPHQRFSRTLSWVPFSILAMKILAKATATFMLISAPCLCR